jgi:transcriptional regulator with XRE-family HTH domain
MPTFGERLRELRQQSGMTQETLASASGISISSVRNYEQDVREPYWEGVFKLAKALGVSSEEFKGCTPGTHRPKGRPRKAPAATQGERSTGKASEDTAKTRKPARKRKGTEKE